MDFTPWDNPMGTDGFEFIEYAAPDPKALGALFEQMGFAAIARHRHKDVTLYRQGEINFIINAEPDSFAQRFARLHGPSICAIAFRVQDAAACLPARAGTGRLGLRQPDRADGAEHPGDQGHRRFADLFRRPLARQACRQRRCRRHRRHQHLRRRFRRDPGRRGQSEGLRPDLHRPPDAQRASRPHEGVGRVLREPVQLPRDALLRHRRQADRPEIEGDDFALRQDPHPDQRIVGRQVADRRIPRPVPRRRHPAHRARHRRHLCHGGGDEGAPACVFQDTIDTYYDLVDQRLPGHGETAGRTAPAAHPDRRQQQCRARRNCCCRSSPRP